MRKWNADCVRYCFEQLHAYSLKVTDKLCLEICIVWNTVAGEVNPSSKVGGLGLGGTKSSGSRDVGLMELEIFTPTSEKNLLNSLEIRCWSVMSMSPLLSLSILAGRLFDLIASFRRSQVFF